MTFAATNIMPANPLSYEGQVVIPYINKTFDPVSSNNQFKVPTIWVNTSSSTAWILVSKPGGVANWELFAGDTGAILQIDADSGSAEPIDGVITISGGTTGLTTVASSSDVALTGILDLGSGGTSADLTASNGGIFYSTDTTGAILGGTAAARRMLQSGASSAPAWSTSTWPATTTNNALLYSAATNQVGQVPVVDKGVLVTSALGTPEWITPTDNAVFISGLVGNPGWLANGTTGQVLTATTSSPPSWQTSTSSFTGINVQTLTTSGTYTPTDGFLYVKVEVLGGGGGAGSANSTTADQASCGGGGAASEYAYGYFSAATIGASQTFVIGDAGVGSTSDSVNGTGGSSSSFGSLISSAAGGGGSYGTAGITSDAFGGIGGTGGSGGDFRFPGTSGFNGLALNLNSVASGDYFAYGGNGGASFYGDGGRAAISIGTGSGNGNDSVGYGSGGGGGVSINGGTGSGGNGSPGVIIVTEYLG